MTGSTVWMLVASLLVYAGVVAAIRMVGAAALADKEWNEAAEKARAENECALRRGVERRKVRKGTPSLRRKLAKAKAKRRNSK